MIQIHLDLQEDISNSGKSKSLVMLTRQIDTQSFLTIYELKDLIGAKIIDDVYLDIHFMPYIFE